MTAAAPPRVVEPADAEAVAQTLRDCAREGSAVVAYGGGTLQGIGNAPARCDVALHLHGVRGLVDYDPHELTFGALAGTTLAEVTRTLAAAGQFVPFDAPFADEATVGGTLSAGWAGPRRATYGRLRDLLIGSTAALADGTLAHAGGMVVKNVTGYDMSKLYVGALGTLGVVTRANFKSLPLPRARRLALAPVGEDVRERAIATVATLALEPTATLVVDGFARVLPRGGSLRLVALLEGSEAAVERTTRELRSALGRAGVAETMLLDGDEAQRAFASLIDAYVESVDDRSVTYRSPGLPSTAWARVREAGRIVASHGAALDAIADVRTGDAIVRVRGRDASGLANALGEIDAALRAALERSFVIAGAPGLRARIDAWGPAPATLPTLRALKARFDPAGILAPGRYVGGI